MKNNRIDSVSRLLSTRGAGRPKTDQLQGEDLREHVIASAGLVYGEHGYRSTSVAKIIEVAGISRPLFYRLFKSAHDVLDIVVARANDALFLDLSKALQRGEQMLEVVNASIDVYFDWCRSYGPVVGPIYREIADPESPAYRHRRQLVAQMIRLLNALLEQRGRPEMPALFIESLVGVVEHIGSTTFWPLPQPEAVVVQNKAIARRIVNAAIAGHPENAVVPPLESIYAAAR